MKKKSNCMCKIFDLVLKLIRASRINQKLVTYDLMAKIKIKFDANEIEIDSRDFYLDNQTVGNVIENLSKHMNENVAETEYENPTEPSKPEANSNGLDSLEDAEVFEPEFNEPKPIEPDEIKSKLRTLEESRFFDSPRTVTETVQQLREIGWVASSLDVSKTLAKMASSKEISKNSEEDRMYYFVQNSLLTT